jgi:hypothetical protein
MTFLLYWLTGFRGEEFKTFFPIGSYVKTTVCLLKAAILSCPVTTTSIQDGCHEQTYIHNIEPYGSMGFE